MSAGDAREFRASVKHSEDSVNAFTAAQFKLFQKKKRYIIIAVAAMALLLGAMALLGRTLSVILALVGCLLFVDLRFIPRRTAELILRQPGALDSVQYRFGEDGIEVWASNGHTLTGYDKVVCMAETGQFYLVFISQSIAYTVDKATLAPADTDGFKSFVASMTCQSWRKPENLASLSLASIIKGLRRE